MRMSNRISRAFLVSCASALLLTGLIGCDNNATPAAGGASNASGSDVKKKGSIGVSLLVLSNPFFKEMGDAITAEAAKQGYDVVVQSADQDPAKQRDQVKNFIVAKAAAIILTPADSMAVGTAIKEANDAGIPVFTCDIASTAEGAKVVAHVATDNYGGGVQAAAAIAEALGGNGSVAIIDHPEVESVIQRTKGFETEIAKTPGIKVVAKLAAGGQRERAFKVTQDILQSNPDVSAIFAINDPSALGAVAALEAAGKLANVKVVGFDGQPEAKQAVKDGKLLADAMQSPADIGAKTVQAFVSYTAGDKVEPNLLIPTSLYKKADADKDPSLK